MARIHQLDANVVNNIAAGEVVERPASVVKELLENSIDALATRIEIDVDKGGSELIRVVDNGEGIDAADLPLTISSHATSKIRTADDLFRVSTMGFRGEALASIASISQFRIRSRPADCETGYELKVEGGEASQPRACGCPAGTMIEVRNLFVNTPVRRKFLKTMATEFSHISERFTRIALPHPRLHAVLRHNNKPVFELPATDDLSDRIRLFFGASLSENLIRIESQSDNVRLWGYAAHPSMSKSTRKGQFLFLNGRWIEDRSLGHALSEAYRGLLMTGRFPIAFLFLEMPPECVDVNVHPTKTEVRFRDAGEVYRLLLATLRTKFLGMDLNSAMKIPNEPGADSPTGTSREQQREIQQELSTWAKDQLAQWKPTESIGKGIATVDLGNVTHERDRFLEGRGDSFDAIPATDDSLEGTVPVSEPDLNADTPAPTIQGEPAPSQRELQQTQPHGIMQIHDCYLVVDTQEGLTVIDQHALHERILYEQLRRRVLSGAVESQRMLIPQTIELSSGETTLLLEHREMLSNLGLGVEEFGKTTLLLTSYPPMLARADLTQLIRDIAEGLSNAGQTPSRRDILDSLLHMISCKAAIKAGQRLTPEEMESLLEQRHLVDDAHHCPHGRPTALVLSRTELDRQFGRLG